MARNRTKRKASIEGPFAARTIAMLESWPYRVLSKSAHQILARLEIELAHHGGNDNGALPCTYDHFEEYGIDRHSIAPALRELEALGFIKWVPGAAGNAEFRRAGIFTLTYKHIGVVAPTNDWRHIETLEEAQATARLARLEKNPRWGKLPASVLETPTETPQPPVGETHTKGRGKNPHYLYISGREHHRVSSPIAQRATKAP
jgi:hypothetical protein